MHLVTVARFASFDVLGAALVQLLGDPGARLLLAPELDPRAGAAMLRLAGVRERLWVAVEGGGPWSRITRCGERGEGWFPHLEEHRAAQTLVLSGHPGFGPAPEVALSATATALSGWTDDRVRALEPAHRRFLAKAVAQASLGGNAPGLSTVDRRVMALLALVHPPLPAAPSPRPWTPPDDPALGRLADLAAELGLAARWVGGVVRDGLLGRASDDWDVVVHGDAVALGRAAAGRLGGCLRVHGAFGTATWILPGGRHVDLITARTESYPGPGRLPVVAAGGFRADALRRDFSVNTLAMPLGGPATLIDPCGGAADLASGRLGVLHHRSFVHDPTRVLRLARYASRLSLRPHRPTLDALDQAHRSGALANIGLERWGAALDRLFAEPDPAAALGLLGDWKVLGLLGPGLDGRRLIARIRSLEGPGSLAAAGTAAPWLALAMGLSGQHRAARVRMVVGGKAAQQRWLLGPDRLRRTARSLGRATTAGPVGERLRALDGVELACLGAWYGEKVARWVGWWTAEGQRCQTVVNGRSLQDVGVAAGPALGRGIRAAQHAAWAGASGADQRAAALRAIRRAQSKGVSSQSSKGPKSTQASPR